METPGEELKLDEELTEGAETEKAEDTTATVTEDGQAQGEAKEPPELLKVLFDDAVAEGLAGGMTQEEAEYAAAAKSESAYAQFKGLSAESESGEPDGTKDQEKTDVATEDDSDAELWKWDQQADATLTQDAKIANDLANTVGTLNSLFASYKGAKEELIPKLEREVAELEAGLDDADDPKAQNAKIRAKEREIGRLEVELDRIAEKHNALREREKELFAERDKHAPKAEAVRRARALAVRYPRLSRFAGDMAGILESDPELVGKISSPAQMLAKIDETRKASGKGGVKPAKETAKTAADSGKGKVDAKAKTETTERPQTHSKLMDTWDRMQKYTTRLSGGGKAVASKAGKAQPKSSPTETATQFSDPLDAELAYYQSLLKK